MLYACVRDVMDVVFFCWRERGKQIAKSGVEGNETRQHFLPEIPWCNFQVRSKSRYCENDSLGIELLCG